MWRSYEYYSIFFFNDPATTEIYTLSLHDALPISRHQPRELVAVAGARAVHGARAKLTTNADPCTDRKSTRLNSSHSQISYAVFCLKKKKIFNYNYELTDSFSFVDIFQKIVLISH